MDENHLQMIASLQLARKGSKKGGGGVSLATPQSTGITTGTVPAGLPGLRRAVESCVRLRMDEVPRLLAAPAAPLNRGLRV